MTIYTKHGLTIEVTDATQYATIYDAATDRAVATAQRRRVGAPGPLWTVFSLQGDEMFSTFFGNLTTLLRRTWCWINRTDLFADRDLTANEMTAMRAEKPRTVVQENMGRQAEELATIARTEAVEGLPDLDDAFWGNHLTPNEAKEAIRAQYDALAALAANLGHLDHDIARDLNTARSSLFAAWSKARRAEEGLKDRANLKSQGAAA